MAFSEHLTVESYTVFICQQSYLLLFGISSPTHSFISGLKPSFSANPSHRSPSFFFFRIYHMDSLDCLPLLLSISVFSLTRLYVDIGALPLNELHNFQILQFVHKCIYHHHKLPQMFSTYFTKNSMFHTYNTRTKEGLHIDLIRSSPGQRCIKYKGSVL